MHVAIGGQRQVDQIVGVGAREGSIGDGTVDPGGLTLIYVFIWANAPAPLATSTTRVGWPRSVDVRTGSASSFQASVEQHRDRADEVSDVGWRPTVGHERRLDLIA